MSFNNKDNLNKMNGYNFQRFNNHDYDIIIIPKNTS